MTEMEELEFGDYDLPVDFDVRPIPASEALDYPDMDQDILGGVELPGNAPNTPAEAIDRAREMMNNRVWVGVGMCLKTVRGYYGLAAKYGSAEDSWNNAEHKVHVREGKNIPRGVPVYWTNGRYGHIAISLGGGLCLSTDWKEAGRIDVAVIDEIGPRWGQQLQGYAWEVNDVVVWKPAPPKPTVALANLRPGTRHADVGEVKMVLRKKGYKGFIVASNKFGPGLRRAYGQYQRRLGYSGKDANGIPGRLSLRKLGFKVRS